MEKPNKDETLNQIITMLKKGIHLGQNNIDKIFTLNQYDISTLNIFYEYMDKSDKLDLLTTVFESGLMYDNIDYGKWVLSKNINIPVIDQHIEDAISNYNENKLKYLTDIGLINGYIDKDGNLTEEFQATRAYFYPDEDYPRYKRTNRPITKISYTPNNCKKGLYLPIVRYRSLYHKLNPEDRTCGTFYFYEPDSDNFINLGNVLVAANKIHATLLLEKSNNISISNSRINIILKEISKFLKKWKDVGIDKMEMFSYLIPNEKDDKLNIIKESYNILYETKNTYIGGKIMGTFDGLDYDICKLAREQDYDTVLLQREPGEYRTVTEIYDVRPRNESFNNICKNTLNWNIKETKYPAIWFSEYDFVKI